MWTKKDLIKYNLSLHWSSHYLILQIFLISQPYFGCYFLTGKACCVIKVVSTILHKGKRLTFGTDKLLFMCMFTCALWYFWIIPVIKTDDMYYFLLPLKRILRMYNQHSITFYQYVEDLYLIHECSFTVVCHCK